MDGYDFVINSLKNMKPAQMEKRSSYLTVLYLPGPRLLPSASSIRPITAADYCLYPVGGSHSAAGEIVLDNTFNRSGSIGILCGLAVKCILFFKPI